MRGILGILEAGVEIGAAAKPPSAGGPEHAGVHVDSGCVGVLHMGDKGDAGRPEPRIGIDARHATGRHGFLSARIERAKYCGDVDAHLLENATAAHDAHQAAACIGAIIGMAFCLADFKAARCCFGHGALGVGVFKGFKGGNDLVAEVAEPPSSAGAFCFELV